MPAVHCERGVEMGMVVGPSLNGSTVCLARSSFSFFASMRAASSALSRWILALMPRPPAPITAITKSTAIPRGLNSTDRQVGREKM